MTEKINILYVHNSSEISGGERSLLNLWENLNRDKFGISLICPSVGTFSQAAQKVGVEVIFFVFPKLLSFDLFAIFRAINFLKKTIREKNISILHSYAPRNNVLSAAAAKSEGIFSIWHERNLIIPGEIDWDRKLSFLADRIICNSNAVAERFRSRGKILGKIQVVLNGVNLEKFNPVISGNKIKQEFNIAPGRKIVGMIVSLARRKNYDFFLSAIPLIAEKIPDVAFILVLNKHFGEDPVKEAARIKQMAQQMNLDKYLVFSDFRDDMPEVIASFDILVLTSVLEACSRIILEAMAMAKPVVAFNSGGNPELVENDISGKLVLPLDKEKFIEAVLFFLKDENKTKEFGLRARERVEKFFDVKRNTRETEKIYLELLNNNAK